MNRQLQEELTVGIVIVWLVGYYLYTEYQQSEHHKQYIACIESQASNTLDDSVYRTQAIGCYEKEGK